MAFVLKDRVKQTSTSNGQNDLTLNGSVDGFNDFSVLSNGDTTYYALIDGSNWEVGIGTYLTSGPTLQRTTVINTSAGNTTKISCSSNAKPVFITQPADKAVFEDASNNVNVGGNVTVQAQSPNIILDDTDANAVYMPVGSIQFKGKDSASNSTEYARIMGQIGNNVTNGSEEGRLYFGRVTNGGSSPTNVMWIQEQDVGLGDEQTITWYNHKGTTHECVLDWATPTAARTITFPDTTGTVALTSNLSSYAALSGATFNGVVTANAGVVVDNITIDGTEIDLSSGDLTIDVAGDIVLDAGGGDILLKDDGALVGTIGGFASNNVVIKNEVSDGDVKIEGNDGGSAITALSFDMSDSGGATFSSYVTATTNVNVGTGGGFYLKQDSSESVIRSESQPIILQTFASSAWQDRLTVANNGTATFANSVIVDNRLTSKALTLNDNGVSGVIFELRTDDDGPWAFRIGNDTVGANAGYSFYQHSNGTCNHYTYGNGSYVTTSYHTNDGSNNINYMTVDTNGGVTISPGTGQCSNDACLYITTTTNNDWGLIVDKYNGSSNEYGVRIDVGASQSYGLQIRGSDNEVFRVAGNGTTYIQNTLYAYRFTDLTNTGFYCDPATTSVCNQFDSLGVGVNRSGTAGEIRASNNITAYYSDERLKDFHGKIENAVDKVKNINGYYYSENEKAKEFGYERQDKIQVGVSAQEIEKVLPEVVSLAPFDIGEDQKSKSGEDYKTVDYARIVPLLIEAIKEQQEQIKTLEEKLDGLTK